MKPYLTIPVVLLAAAAAVATQTQTASSPPAGKVAVLNIQGAALNTQDGQQSMADLQSRFGPRKARLEKNAEVIEALRERARKGSASLSEEAKAKLEAEIAGKNKALSRESEDFNADAEQEQAKVMQQIGPKLMAVVGKYAAQNGYSVVLDISNPQTPVVWNAPLADITEQIVKSYDQAHPAAPRNTTGQNTKNP